MQRVIPFGYSLRMPTRSSLLCDVQQVILMARESLTDSPDIAADGAHIALIRAMRHANVTGYDVAVVGEVVRVSSTPPAICSYDAQLELDETWSPAIVIEAADLIANGDALVDAFERAGAHAVNHACGYLGCEIAACIVHRHECGNECGVPDCDACDRHFHAPARRQAKEDASEAHGDWLRDEGEDARIGGAA